MLTPTNSRGLSVGHLTAMAVAGHPEARPASSTISTRPRTTDRNRWRSDSKAADEGESRRLCLVAPGRCRCVQSYGVVVVIEPAVRKFTLASHPEVRVHLARGRPVRLTKGLNKSTTRRSQDDGRPRRCSQKSVTYCGELREAAGASGLNSLVGRSGLNRQPPRSNFLVTTASATLYPVELRPYFEFLHAGDFPS
jgi:hypothetical protein